MNNLSGSQPIIPPVTRRYSWFLFSAILLVTFIGTGSLRYSTLTDKASSELKTSGKPMTLVTYYWPGYYWIDIADKKGWFAEAGLNVKLVDANTDYYKSIVDFSEGKIDVNQVTLFDLMGFVAQGKDLVMVNVTDTGFGAEGIVAKQSIEDIDSLKGKKIGVPTGTYLEYMLDLVLENNRISLSDVLRVPIRAENAQNEFATGAYDAVMTWDPYFSNIAKFENGKILFDSSEIRNISPEGITVARTFLNERPNDIQALVGLWYKTTAFIKENPEEAFGIIAKIYDVPVGDVQVFTTKNRILSLRENLTAFSYSAGFESLHGVARSMNNFLIEHNVTDRQFDSTQFLNPRFIRSLEVE